MSITQNGALKRDDNDNPVMGGTSSADNATIINAAFDPVTRRLLTDTAGGGSGTVTSVSVVSANGFAGSVATATTTPAITLSTTITGVLKGNGTAISAASDSTDYAAVAFKTISVSGQSDVVADSPIDTLTLAAGANITITTNAGTDTVTIAASGGGGSPGGSDTQVQYNNAGTFGGDPLFTFDGASVFVGDQAAYKLRVGNNVIRAIGDTTDQQAELIFQNNNFYFDYASVPQVTDNGGSLTFEANRGGATSGHAGGVTFIGGDAQGGDSNGGSLTYRVGQKTGAGSAGRFIFAPKGGATVNGILDFDSLDTSDKTFIFPNVSGTLALTSQLGITIGTTTITSGTTTRILYNNSGVVGEYTLTGSGTVVAMATAPTFVTSITTPSVLATANDSGALGASGTAFSDLFLASGAVINFAAGDYTLTHSTGILTANKDFRITSANVGTNADSVPTNSSTSTLTNKTLTSPTLTTPSAFTTGGTITLAENTSIALDPAGSADGKYTGITVTGTAGYTQAFGDLVYLDPTDSRWEAADANAASGADGDARGLLAMVVSAGTDGNPCTLLLNGIIRADAKFPTFTVNNPIYVSETAGSVTQTQPTTTDVVIRIVGAALTADEMYFNPDFTWITHT